ncbi:hypothetical protein Mapa_000380 [Marchantia paleacea]|nr:hypothetical protein Mapa_000380 [Marchantia paleacea]
MAKPSSNAAPAFKAISYRAPAPAPGAQRAAAAASDNYPVPVYLVMRTDWRFSKRSGRHQQQTTTVVSAFTTLQPAQEAALIAFEKFVNEYHYAGERSVENRLSWYSWWNGRNKAHFGEVKEIAEDMKKWPAKWKGDTAEVRYEKMVEAMETVKSRLPNGSIFNVEKASLPPSARARAVNAPTPVPFKVFVLTENHWSWSKPVDVTNVLAIFTCFAQARAAGVDAYHAYIHSSHQERKRLKWDKTGSAYDKMLKNVLADKVTWEKTAREYGTSFSIDECYLYPRGAYFRHQDEVLPKAENLSSLPRAGSSMRGTYPAAAHVEQSPHSSSSTAAAAAASHSEQARAGEDGPRAHGFIRRTYAMNPEKKKDDRAGTEGSEGGAAAAAAASAGRLKGILQHRRGDGERVQEAEALAEAGPSAAATRGAHHVTFEDERREGHGEFEGDDEAGFKKRKTWKTWMPPKEDDLIGAGRGAGAGGAGGSPKAARAHHHAPGAEFDRRRENERADPGRQESIHQDGVEIPEEKDNIVYHRAYAYVASTKRRNEVHSELEEAEEQLDPTPAYTGDDELSSEEADYEVEDFVEADAHLDDVRRWVDDQAGVLFGAEGYVDEADDDHLEESHPGDKSAREDEEVLSEVDDDQHESSFAREDGDGGILPEGNHHFDCRRNDPPRNETSEYEDEEGLSEVDDQLQFPVTSEGDEGDILPEGDGDQSDHHPATAKSSGEDEEEVDEVIDFAPPREDKGEDDQLDDSLSDSKAGGQDEEVFVQHVQDQRKRQFVSNSSEPEIGVESDRDQQNHPASKWESGDYEEEHEQLKRHCRNVVRDRQREERPAGKKAGGGGKEVLRGEVEYYITSEGYAVPKEKSVKCREFRSGMVGNHFRGEGTEREAHRNEKIVEPKDDEPDDSFHTSVVPEDTAGRRREAPHLDLVLKRNRNHAFLKADDTSSEEGFGRGPVGGGYKIPS